MSAAGHTPGPWLVWKDKNGCYSVDPSPNCKVASLWHPPIGSAEANARLIASAPDMLTALKETIDVLSSRYQNLSNGHWEDGELQLLARQIEAAIAKAEGQT